MLSLITLGMDIFIASIYKRSDYREQHLFQCLNYMGIGLFTFRFFSSYVYTQSQSVLYSLLKLYCWHVQHNVIVIISIFSMKLWWTISTVRL